jgi:uncharacterized protein (DUF1697 family)
VASTEAKESADPAAVEEAAVENAAPVGPVLATDVVAAVATDATGAGGASEAIALWISAIRLVIAAMPSTGVLSGSERGHAYLMPIGRPRGFVSGTAKLSRRARPTRARQDDRMTTTHVALLRAINVGGATVRMERLRELAVNLGWTDVATHLNSGNLLLGSGDSASAVAKALSAALEDDLGREVPVVVRTPAQLAAALERARPVFPHAEPRRVQIAFLDHDPGDGADERLGDFAPDEHRHLGAELALHYPNGQARTKLTTVVIERRLGVVATVRGLGTIDGVLARVRP